MTVKTKIRILGASYVVWIVSCTLVAVLVSEEWAEKLAAAFGVSLVSAVAFQFLFTKPMRRLQDQRKEEIRWRNLVDKTEAQLRDGINPQTGKPFEQPRERGNHRVLKL